MTTARVLEALNSLIRDDDFQIGPSYFMGSASRSEAGLQRAWRSAILPLLEEHHYGESIDVAKRYDLVGILKRASTADVDAVEPGSDPSEAPSVTDPVP